MAQIVFSADELVRLLSAYLVTTGRISEVKAEQSKIKFKIKTPGILPSVTVTLVFESFSQGIAHFALHAGSLVKLVTELFEMPDSDWVKITSSRISVDVNAMVRKKIPDISIMNIQQLSPGQFLVDIRID